MGDVIRIVTRAKLADSDPWADKHAPEPSQNLVDAMKRKHIGRKKPTYPGGIDDIDV